MTDTHAYTAGLPRKRVSAGVLFVDGTRLLMIQPTYKQYWDLPGGIVEHGESPRDAAAREVKEELGLVVVPQRLLVVDYFPERPGAATEAVMLIFNGGRLNDYEQRTIRTTDDEVAAWAWLDVEQMRERTHHAPLLQQRVFAAWQAHHDGDTYYLEAGRHPVYRPA